MAGNPCRKYAEGSIICTQGSSADCIYRLRRGRVGVLVNLDEKTPDLPTISRKGVLVAEIEEPGSMVGEAGLFLERRTASLRALASPTEVECIPIDHDGVRKLILNKPETGLTLCRSLATRLRTLSRRLRNAGEVIGNIQSAVNGQALAYLRLIQAAENLEAGGSLHRALEKARANPLYEFARQLRKQQDDTRTVFDIAINQKDAGKVTLEPATELLREGDRGSALYFVQQGALEVRVGGRVVATIGPGEIVGEVAVLLREEPLRTASLKAVEYTELAAIRTDEFNRIATERPSILVNLAYTLSRRIDRANRMACDLNRGLEEDLERLAGTSGSCEHAFRSFVRAMPARAEGLDEIREKAERYADHALEVRRNLEAAYRKLTEPTSPPGDADA